MCGVSSGSSCVECLQVVLTFCVELVSSAILWTICGFVMFEPGKMKALCYVVLLVGAICSGEAGEIIQYTRYTNYYDLSFIMTELTLRPIDNTQPSEFVPINTFVFITCEIVASFPLNGSSVESRWFLPNGTVVTFNDGSESKYEIIQGDGPDEYETIVLIQPIIYSDAGNYTCEVRDRRDPNDIGDWISAQATLVLLGKFLTQCSLFNRVSTIFKIYSGIDC